MPDEPMDRMNYRIISREKEIKEVLYRIASGSMLVIEGKKGSGKTALLRYAINNFKGKGKVVYLNGNRLNKRPSISSLLRKKGMILLLDNVHSLTMKNNEQIKFYYDNGDIESVAFTTNDYEKVRFSDAMKGRIGRNIITLAPLNKEDAVKAARERYTEEIIPDEVLKKLYDGDMKLFLYKCQALFEYVTQKGNTATLDDIKRISEMEEEADESTVCLNCGSNLVQIGEYWRCKKCDNFCKDCGHVIYDRHICKGDKK